MFSAEPTTDFQLFSTEHLIVLIIFGIVSVLIYLFRVEIRESPKWSQTIRWGFFAILLGSEVSFQIWSVQTGMWDARSYIPIELCSISTYVAIFLLLKWNKKVFEIFYFIGFIPPLLAIVTPDLVYGFPHYRFLKFFLHHMTIPWTLLFFVFVWGARPRWQSIFTTFVLLNIYAVPVYFVNNMIGSNYLFLMGAPASNTLLDLFGDPPAYQLNLELTALALFAVMYLPVFVWKMTRGGRAELGQSQDVNGR